MIVNFNYFTKSINSLCFTEQCTYIYMHSVHTDMFTLFLNNFLI